MLMDEGLCDGQAQTAATLAPGHQREEDFVADCIRHAGAHSVKVNVTGYDDRLDVSVTDDGVGLEPTRRRDGLGLRGIEERVKNLHGAMTIHGAAGEGTTLTIRLPLPAPVTEVPRARAAG